MTSCLAGAVRCVTPLRFVVALLALCLCWVGLAVADVPATEQSMVQAGMDADLAQYARAVSVNEGNWNSVGGANGVKCYGLFQFCDGGTFERYSNGLTPDQFLADHAAQVNAYREYAAANWAIAVRGGLTSAVGKSGCWTNRCAIVTDSSVLMACQFGCGSGGKLAHYVKNGYSCTGPYNTADGSGTTVCKYLVTGANYNVSSITGQTNDSSAPNQCLVNLSPAQLYLSVPYGASRTGQGTGGNEWEAHSIGLASTAQSSGGSAPEVLAGFAGKASWHPSSAPGGSSVEITSSDGSMKLAYSGLNDMTGQINTASPTVTQSQPLGQMSVMPPTGSTNVTTGMPGFNIALAVSKNALKAAGLNGRAGTIVPCPSCSVSPSGNTAVGSDKIADAGARTYYYVDPETYLSHQISVLPQTQSAYPAAFAGRASPSSTLPVTGAPSSEVIKAAAPSSGGTGASRDGGTSGIAGYRNGSDDYPATLAGQSERSLWLELSHESADSLRVEARANAARDVTDIALAHLLLIETNKAGR